MSKVWLRRIVTIAVFIIAVLVIDALMNKKTVDVTTEMLPASLPVIHVRIGSHEVNTMRGYTTKRDESYMRESITPVAEDRSISLSVDTFSSEVMYIHYEVRSGDGERLIENGEITNAQREGEKIDFSLQLKDLIMEDREYVFVTILTMRDGNRAYYYTRFIQNGEFEEEPKLNFVRWFHDTLYGGTKGEELQKYLETDSQKGNQNFHQVTIKSSLDQVMWDELEVERVGEPVILIREISDQTMGVILQYTVKSKIDKNTDYYAVEEYLRIRYTPERVYLLDYERYTDEYFQADRNSFVQDRIKLGITSADFLMEETEGGKMLAFVSGSRLFAYNTIENELAQIFSFYDEANFDLRTTARNFSIKILNMEDGGNLTFMVSGYMNRGIHEGQVGSIVYYYDSVSTLVEELVFLPYEKSADILMKEVENLSYLSMDHRLYFLLGGNLYAISLETREYEIINSGLTEEVYKVSESERSIAWPEKNQALGSTSLIWMNLSNGEQEEIKVDGGNECITPLGFIGEDLVYGIVKAGDIVTDESGNTIFPAYKVVIAGPEGKKLKTYEKSDIYITGCRMEGNQIALERVMKTEDGEYYRIEDDQIASKDIGEGAVNQVSETTDGVHKTVVQILLKNQVEVRSLKTLIPREVIFEGGREVVLEAKDEIQVYYVYGSRGVEEITTSSSKAVSKAYDVSGAALNDQGKYIWKKTRTYTRNQIMAIEGEKQTKLKSSLAVCLDTILWMEGVSLLTQPMLDKGEDAFSILDKNLRNADILDLTGCSLDAVLNFPDQDIPVLALLEEGGAVLIIGFNEQNTVIMDPLSGTVYKKGMNDSRILFEESGNRFITYVRKEGT